MACGRRTRGAGRIKSGGKAALNRFRLRCAGAVNGRAVLVQPHAGGICMISPQLWSWWVHKAAAVRGEATRRATALPTMQCTWRRALLAKLATQPVL